MEDDMAGSIQPLMRFFIPMKKMAAALSELVRGVNPIMICLGSRRDDGELDMNFHGKSSIGPHW